MPNRILLIFITLLLGIGSASAQKYPERSLVRKGNRDFAKERYDRSIERYTQALEAAPENFEAAYNLGGALYRTEKYEEAAKMLERIAADSTRTDQERAEAFYNLGNAQFKQEKYPEALESYKNSLRMNPADQEAKYNYAYTKRLLDQNQDQNGGGGQNQQNAKLQQGQRQTGSPAHAAKIVHCRLLQILHGVNGSCTKNAKHGNYQHRYQQREKLPHILQPCIFCPFQQNRKGDLGLTQFTEQGRILFTLSVGQLGGGGDDLIVRLIILRNAQLIPLGS